MLIKSCDTNEEVNHILSRMKMAAIEPDIFTWNTLMKRAADRQAAEEILSKMLIAGMAPNIATWKAFMKSCVTQNERHEIIARMQSANITPDIEAWNILMFGANSQDERKEIFRRLLSAALSPDLTTFEALMKGCITHEERMDVASQVISASAGTTIAWTKLIAAAGTDGVVCLVLFESMRKLNVAVKENTLSVLFAALIEDSKCHVLRANKILEIYRELVVGHESDFLSHSLVSSLFRAFALVPGEHTLELTTLWKKCSSHLKRTKTGWPGRSVEKLIWYYSSQKTRKNEVWRFLISKVEGGVKK